MMHSWLSRLCRSTPIVSIGGWPDGWCLVSDGEPVQSLWAKRATTFPWKSSRRFIPTQFDVRKLIQSVPPMDSSDPRLEDTLHHLLQDVRRSVGREYEPPVHEIAERLCQLSTADVAAKCVDDVQQFFHDTFVDPSWPACPRHLNHPLAYRDGAWHCAQEGVRIARLGELVPTPEREI